MHWAVFKRGYHGTFHHFSKKHMARYINEFIFRLNEGNCGIDTVDKIESMVAGVSGKYLSYEGLVR